MHDQTRVRDTADPAATSVAQESSGEGTIAQSADGAAHAAAQSKGIGDDASTTFGYEIVGELGRGAMGVVYHARHTKLNRRVALKMAIEGRMGEKDLIRFLAEAEAVAAVRHPNVVQVYDYGEVDGRPFMALEFCPGGSLAGRLEKGPPLAPAEVAEVLRHIASGVAAAHEEGIVHRDLKPANVLLTDAGEPKVADFGIAKQRGRDLTATQAVMGTPFYMAPEQAGGKAKFVGPPADVWALGVMLYECLTGARPFAGETAGEVIANVISSEPAPVRAHAPNVPADLELICRKCLEKNPADRYPSARELADDLGRFARREPISVRPLAAPARAARWARRNPLLAGLFAAVALVTLGLIGSLYGQYRQAVAQADIERAARDSAEGEREQADIARRNAERAAEETRLRAQAEERAKHAAAQAALANDLIALLDDLFRSSDPLAGFFGDALPSFAPSAGGEAQAAALGPFLRNAASRFRASLTDPGVALVRARLLVSIGNGMKTLGMFREGKELLEEALALRRAALPETDPAVWQAELDLGRLETESGDLLGAVARFRKVLAIQRKAGAGPEATLPTRLYEGVTLSSLGLPDAGAVLREVVAEREKLNGKVHKDTLLAKLALMTWLLERNQWTEAVALFAEFSAGVRALPDVNLRRILEPILECQQKLAVANVAKQPGSLLAGSLRTSIDGMKKDIARLEKLLPEDHLILGIFRFELAKLLLHVGDAGEADELLARVYRDARRTAGLGHSKALPFLEVYSERLAATKRLAEARALFDEVEAANRRQFGGENPWRTLILLLRAGFEAGRDAPKALACAKEGVGLMESGKFLPTAVALRTAFDVAKELGGADSVPLRAEARRLFAALRPLVARTFGEASKETVILLVPEGKMLYESGDRAAAAAAFERALGLLPRVADLPPIERVNVLYWCGRLELDRGRFGAAERHFRATRDAGKKVPDYSAADREEDALYLARSLAAQGKFGEAGPLFEEARRLAPKLNRNEAGLAWADMHVAVAQLAAGDRAAHRASLEAMTAKYGKSQTLDTLARLAWAGGLAADAEGWDAGAFAAKFRAAFKPTTSFAWGYRGLALVCLRAGDFAGMEAALAKAGKTPRPVDHLIRGLAAVARGDRAAARDHLAKAEEMIEAAKPNEKNPFAYARRSWNQHTEAAILLAEFRAALAPPVAPPPRPKG